MCYPSVHPGYISYEYESEVSKVDSSYSRLILTLLLLALIALVLFRDIPSLHVETRYTAGEHKSAAGVQPTSPTSATGTGLVPPPPSPY